MTNHTIGVDISKDHLDVHCLGDGRAARFGNGAAGFRELEGWLPKAAIARIVYEATGPYHAAFEMRFATRYPLVKVNPLQARRFAQSKGTRAKTDAVDARMLAQMGAAFDLEPSAPISQNMRDLKEMQIARVALITDRTRLLNRLKTQTLAINKRHTTARLTQIARQIHDLDAEIQAGIAVDQPTARAHQILCSIPPLGHVKNMPCRATGIGAITAAAVLIDPLMIYCANHCRAMDARDWNHHPQTGGQSRRSGTHDAPVRTMERQGVHRENDPPDRFLILCTPRRT